MAWGQLLVDSHTDTFLCPDTIYYSKETCPSMIRDLEFPDSEAFLQALPSYYELVDGRNMLGQQIDSIKGITQPDLAFSEYIISIDSNSASASAANIEDEPFDFSARSSISESSSNFQSPSSELDSLTSSLISAFPDQAPIIPPASSTACNFLYSNHSSPYLNEPREIQQHYSDFKTDFPCLLGFSEDTKEAISLPELASFVASSNSIDLSESFSSSSSVTSSLSKSQRPKSKPRGRSIGKTFTCSFPDCNQNFYRSDELTRHERKHSGQKPFDCLMCSKKFARSDHLNDHLKRHLRNCNYMCQLSGCNATIPTPKYLKIHMAECHPNYVAIEGYVSLCRKKSKFLN